MGFCLNESRVFRGFIGFASFSGPFQCVFRVFSTEF